jgi:hypothetical protein
MPDRPTVDTWPGLRWRLDSLNARHAHVTVFDRGARSGTLILDHRTWERLVAGPPPSPAQVGCEEAAKLGEPGPGW